MKRYIKILFAAVVGVVLAGCTSDEDGGAFMGGDEAMTFTASTSATRATINGDWDGMNGEQVAVCVGGEVKPYTIHVPAGGLVGSGVTGYETATLSSDDPHYWTKAKETVTAWYPYAEGMAAGDAGGVTMPDVVVERDQSTGDGYLASDWLAAEQAVEYGGNNALVFRHRTAKVTVSVTSDVYGVSPAACKVAICIGDDSEGILAYQNSGSGNPAAFSALVAPVNDAALTVIITCGEQKFRYQHPTAYNFEANKQYALSLALKRDKVELETGDILPWDKQPTTSENIPDYVDADGTHHVFTVEGLSVWAAAADADRSTSCILEADITLPEVADGESNWTPVALNGTFDGNGHTITGLTVNIIGQNCVGFISQLYGGTVKNLTLKDVSITATIDYAGAVAGDCLSGGSIYGCQVIGGTVKGTYSVGGIVGSTDEMSKIYACSATCSVEGDHHIGGIVGHSICGINACWTNCSISGNYNVGSIVGWYSNSGTSTACYYKNKDVGDNYGTKVDGTTVKWAEGTDTKNVMSAMNTALSTLANAGFECDYIWAENPDAATKAQVPLVLVKKE